MSTLRLAPDGQSHGAGRETSHPDQRPLVFRGLLLEGPEPLMECHTRSGRVLRLEEKT